MFTPQYVTRKEIVHTNCMSVKEALFYFIMTIIQV